VTHILIMKQSFSIACFFDESTLRMVLKSLEVEEHFLQTKSHIQCRYYHIHNYMQLYLKIFSHDWWLRVGQWWYSSLIKAQNSTIDFSARAGMSNMASWLYLWSVIIIVYAYYLQKGCRNVKILLQYCMGIYSYM